MKKIFIALLFVAMIPVVFADFGHVAYEGLFSDSSGNLLNDTLNVTLRYRQNTCAGTVLQTNTGEVSFTNGLPDSVLNLSGSLASYSNDVFFTLSINGTSELCYPTFATLYSMQANNSYYLGGYQASDFYFSSNPKEYVNLSVIENSGYVNDSTGVIGLFTGCSGTEYLGADGACHADQTGGSGGGYTADNLSSPTMQEYANNKFGFNETWGNATYVNEGDDVNTNANTLCSGATTYLNGEGGCDDISSVYYPLSTNPSGFLNKSNSSLYLDNTDSQTLGFNPVAVVLNISGGNQVDLSSLEDMNNWGLSGDSGSATVTDGVSIGFLGGNTLIYTIQETPGAGIEKLYIYVNLSELNDSILAKANESGYLIDWGQVIRSGNVTSQASSGYIPYFTNSTNLNNSPAQVSGNDVLFSNGIRIGTTSDTTAGNIRYTSNQFQGYNGTDWTALGGGGGADTTCEDTACNLSDDYGYLFTNLSFGGTTGFSDLIDNDTQLSEIEVDAYVANNNYLDLDTYPNADTDNTDDLTTSGGTITGNLVINGNFTLIGSMLNATVTNQYLNGSFLPSIHNTFNIGSTGQKWANMYATTLYGSLHWNNLTGVPSGLSDGDDVWNLNNSDIINQSNSLALNKTTLDAEYVGQSEYPNLDTDSTDDFDGVYSSLTGTPTINNSVGDCGSGEAVQNTTESGVECITLSSISDTNLSGSAAGGDLSGTYPNPSVQDDSHSHSNETITSLDTNKLLNTAYLNQKITLAGENITSGTVADARIASTIARDSELPLVTCSAGTVLQNTTNGGGDCIAWPADDDQPDNDGEVPDDITVNSTSYAQFQDDIKVYFGTGKDFVMYYNSSTDEFIIGQP